VGLVNLRGAGAGEERQFSEDPGVAAIEREAVEALAETARQFVTRLPSNSRWRDPFIDVSDLAAVFRQQETEARRDQVVG
jgi:hypothetical protein